MRLGNPFGNEPIEIEIKIKMETKAYIDSFKTRIEIKTNDSKTTQNESDFDFTFVKFTTNSLVRSQISILLDII